MALPCGMPENPYLTLVQPWTVGQSESLCPTRVFDLRKRHCASPTSPTKQGDYVFLDCADWVNVVALTDSDTVIMIEQFRAGLNAVTLELVGGMVDEGETPTAAAIRELAEESGYAGGDAKIIGRVSANPAIQNNWVHTVLITGCSRKGLQALDSNEEIGVREVALRDVPSLIGNGTIHHSLVVAAFYHFGNLVGR